MLSHFCKDLAVQYIKTIVDCNRCKFCDKLDGTRLRFACGHSACTDCVAVADCPICSPLMDPGSSWPHADEPQTQRVSRASELLTSFQDTFQIDVYQQQRISERLKVEKELFPECIQAPSQYFNKRKSLCVSKNNKENQPSTFFPGEKISSTRKVTMSKSRNYVQEWLNKHENNSTSVQSRSPFSDLKVNTHNIQATTHSSTVKGKLKNNAGNLPATNRKRSQLRQTSSISQSTLENYLKPVEKGESKSAWLNAKRLKKVPDVSTKQSVVTEQNKNNCDESGIVIDDDCYTIEDTQEQVIDKDRLALLAVANADKQLSDPVIVDEDTQISDFEEACDDQKDTLYNKVPFYRKSFLFKDCTPCSGNDNVNVIKPKMCTNVDNDSNKFNNISITVENKSFITTINVVDSKSYKTESTAIQTDVEEPFKGFEQHAQSGVTAKLISKIQDYIQSEVLFSEDKDSEVDSQKTGCSAAVFGEKNEIGLNIYKAELSNHHGEHACGILTNIEAGNRNIKRKAVRPITPDSNNSSDKENCDPNRRKKHNVKKKKKSK